MKGGLLGAKSQLENQIELAQYLDQFIVYLRNVLSATEYLSDLSRHEMEELILDYVLAFMIRTKRLLTQMCTDISTAML